MTSRGLKALSGAVLAALVCVLPARAGDIVTVVSPSGTSVAQKEVLFEGRVEERFVKSVRLTIEPFLAKGDEKPYSRVMRISDGEFAESISLFPGLNLIRVATLGGREVLTLPLFLVSPGEGPLERTAELGTRSSVFFTGPSEAKTSANPLIVKGMASDPAVASLDVVVLDTLDLLPGAPGKQAHRIDYLSCPLDRQQFSFKAPLKEGLNIILAKPRGAPADVRSVQIKSIIFEKTSAHLALGEPGIKDGKLVLPGKAGGKLYRKITVKVTALVERPGNPGKLSLETIATKTLTAEKDGSFTVVLPWAVKGYAIKAFPTVTVYAGGENAGKTLTNW
ncbi:MAG: hypothetical protein ACYC5N_11470 [Endomicrobiales bacterium]